MKVPIKAVRAFFSREWVKGITIFVVGGIILAIIQWAWPKLNPFGTLGKALVAIHHWNIPGSFFLIAVVVVIVLLIIVLRKRPQPRPSISGTPVKEVKAKTFSLSDEHGLILITLGVVKGSLTDEVLFKTYVDHFPKNHRLEFKLIIDDLQREKLIDVTPDYSGETHYSILPKGLSYLREIVNAMKASGPREEASMPTDAATGAKLPLEK